MAELPANLPSIHVRQMQIQNDKVRLFMPKGWHCQVAIGNDGNLVASLFKISAQGARDMRFILHD